MSKLSEHFNSTEFQCKCGCGVLKLKNSLIERLEKLHTTLNAHSIIITSGYRCPNHSVAVGGYANDAHTQGFAADIIVYKDKTHPYTEETVAYYADKIGFGGIGIMQGSVHVDTRDVETYSNSYWRGDERTGKNFTPVSLKPESINTTDKQLKIIINGNEFIASNPFTIEIKE